MNNLGINWFDLFVLVMLVVGIFVGRKRGMSLELLSVLQWLMIVFVAAITCEPFGKMLADLSGISPVLTYTAAYLLAAILIKIVFIMIRRMAGEKLVASDVFGNFEYYLGMAAGLIRFACITLFVLALLNAKQVSKAELDAKLKEQMDWAGSIYIPPFGSIQRAVFEESMTGRAVKQYLSAELINVDPAAGKGVARESIGRRRERDVNDVISPK
ncbi:MAG TPA: CvpA family protein [Verrucomicrobiae bacterium]|nr:CvpA family protein [Verrucomicrobiae bacterium]